MLRLLSLVLLGCTSGPGTDTNPDPDGTTTDTGIGTDTGSGSPTPAEAIGLAWAPHPTVPWFAVVSWRQASAGQATVEAQLDGVWRPFPTIDAEPGENELVIAGLPMGSVVRWRLTLEGAPIAGPTPIATEPAPEGLPIGVVTVSDPSAGGGDLLLTSVSETGSGWSTNGPFWTALYDRRGRPVWARRTPRGWWTLWPSVARSGDHLVFDEFRFSAPDGVLIRSHLDGLIARIPARGFHHAFAELPDGTLAWGSYDHGGKEAIVLEGDEVRWTCEDDWPEGSAFEGEPFGGYCTLNGLHYDAASDRFVASFYTNESVVAIDGTTGETAWWAGRVPGGLAFVPSGAQFWWQHGPTITPEGTLLVSTLDASPFTSTPTTTPVREYAVDEEAGTLTEVWSYDPQVLVENNGNTLALSDGGVLHTLGTAGQVVEVGPDGSTRWRLQFAEGRMLGRSELVPDLYALLAPESDGGG